MNTSIKTASGLYFDLADPRPHKVRFRDIAQGLEALPRWTGHTNGTWSVADHSVLTWRLLLADEPDASIERQLHVLLHDAHEAYIGDASTPLKTLIPAFRSLAAHIQRAILAYFRLPPPDEETRTAVKVADARALEIEWRHFMHGTGRPIKAHIAQSIDEAGIPWDHPHLDHTPDEFTRVFHRLMRER